MMDYNVVRANAVNAFRFYKNNDDKYKKAMTGFYTEGKKNPSVAKVILDDTIKKGIKKTSELSDEVMKETKEPVFFPLTEHYAQMAQFEARSSIALRLMKQCINATEIPDDRNMKDLPEKKEFEKSFDELYPRTGEKRRRIIDAHRLEMDAVTPKAKWSDKIMYAKTNAEYRKLYPKSFNTRMALIMEGQIKDNAVTKKVSGFLERFAYFPYVDKTFSFLKKVKK